ncbi:MAG: hypothetical protein A2W17_03375 [Planctomycetes bacterium RBG_16_41_13]|nr:MAG: hypothetical protein A2W17_03375 [Planctomycetes bacterium RBG_16_41_13]
MPDLSNNIIQHIGEMSPFFVPFAVIAASLIGSVHCVGMCGGLALAASAHSKAGLISYHIGRFLGYFCIGSLAGLLGSKFIHSEMKYLSFVSTILLGITFFIIGFRILKEGNLHIKQPYFLRLFYQKRVGRLLEVRVSPKRTGFLIGVLSPLLPCGWLYGFILIAVATHNPLWGGILLFSFWLGTIPALSGISYLAKKPIQLLNNKAKAFVGVFLIFVGISSVIVKLTGMNSNCCH